MSPATKAAVRNAWKTYAPYRGDTENHWAMYYASSFLPRNSGPACRGANGTTARVRRKPVTRSEYLLHWMEVTTTIGQGEFDSPDYFPEYADLDDAPLAISPRTPR